MRKRSAKRVKKMILFCLELQFENKKRRLEQSLKPTQ